MHMLFENMRVREELNKLKFYVHAVGGKRFKFEDKSSFFSLSGCSTAVHLLDHRHFHVLDVVVIGQIKMLGHGKTSSMIARTPWTFDSGLTAFTSDWWRGYPRNVSN